MGSFDLLFSFVTAVVADDVTSSLDSDVLATIVDDDDDDDDDFVAIITFGGNTDVGVARSAAALLPR